MSREGEEEGLFADTATASAGRPQDLCGGSRFRSGNARKQEFLEQEFVGVVFSSTAIARVVVEEDFCGWSELLCDKNVVVSSSTTVHRENPPMSSPSINNIYMCIYEYKVEQEILTSQCPNTFTI